MSERVIPIHRVGIRHNLFMGGDRELVMMSGLVAFALIFAAQDWLASATAIVLWFSSLFILRLMAKYDPQMRYVYLRHSAYRNYYPAHSSPYCTSQRAYS